MTPCPHAPPPSRRAATRVRLANLDPPGRTAVLDRASPKRLDPSRQCYRRPALLGGAHADALADIDRRMRIKDHETDPRAGLDPTTTAGHPDGDGCVRLPGRRRARR